MLGQTYSVGKKLNNSEWHMGEMLGLNFENHIYNVLSRNMEKYYNLGAKIFSTPSARDNGKDIIIESPVVLENVLGLNFYPKGQPTFKIYVECKSSDNGKISYNSFAGNLSRIKEDKIGYYVLITNTTIVPFSYFQFKEEASKLGIEFVLIDQILLEKYLLENNAMIGNIDPHDNFEEIYIEYQTNSKIIESKNAYEIYFWIRNYSDSQQSISMQIGTDRNWISNLENIEHILQAKESLCLKFIVIKKYFDGLNDLILNVNSNFVSTAIQIKGVNLKYNFAPNLVGKRNAEIIKLLSNAITETAGGNIYFIFGEAGAGKSRIIDETLSLMIGRNIDFYRVLTEKGKNVLSQLKKILVNGKNIVADINCASLESILTSINTTYRKCVIVVDDLHNASTKFLDNIRKLLSEGLPSGFTLVFVGRNDYSVGSIDYFSFLQFIEEKYSKNIIEVNALEDAESIQLIKSIVRGIPDIAVERIHSLSNNLPLYIIQVIEYMLDLKLVYLLNRNTVGIENPENFSNHLYIPSSMEDLYRRRINNLLEKTEGKEMLTFLYIISFLGINVSDCFVNIFFEGREHLLQTLLERRYITVSTNGYTIIHESFYLYIQNQIFSSTKIQEDIGNWFINTPDVFINMDNFRKGRICLWTGNKNSAYNYFSTAISDIQSIKNYSSININPDYYPYLEDIYKISSNYEQKKQIIACKIYIALHYHTPYEAVAVCNWAQSKLKHTKKFEKDMSFNFFLKEQIAHSYINAGQLKKSENILADLLSQTILNINCCDSKAVFDMYDKLSSIYLKYNIFHVAENYSMLSLALAKELKDDNLQALSYITTAKLYLYTNRLKSIEYLQKADNLLSEETAYRIKCHNDVSLLIMRLLNASEENMQYNLKDLIAESFSLLDICIKNNFANSVIRIYMLLAVLYYYVNIGTNMYTSSLQYIEKGINASIKFGISTYIWQFYNLKAIIYVHQNEEKSKQKSLFDTVFNILKRQNLTYLGNCDCTYGNMLALTNIMFFYRMNETEEYFYQKMNLLTLAESINACDFNCNKTTCHYECHTDIKLYKKEWNKLFTLKNKQTILFNKVIEPYPLQDDDTGYYIILS